MSNSMHSFTALIRQCALAGVVTWSISATVYAAVLTTDVFTGNGQPLGRVVFEDTKYGLLIKPQLFGLSPGLHGFHIHQYPDCRQNGTRAGGHLDSFKANTHQGPYGEGHVGDLPVLIVNSAGIADIPVLAPRLTIQDLKGHALMIHAGGDNYHDVPPMGGGAARIGCAEIS